MHKFIISCILSYLFLQKLGSCKRCNNDTINGHNHSLAISYTEQIIGTLDDIRLSLNVTWKISDIADEDFDGFLVRVFDVLAYKSVNTIEGCQASGTYLWVTTRNESFCDISNASSPQCDLVTLSSGSISCKCKKYCPLFEGISCIGANLLLKQRSRPYRSLPKTLRSANYEVKFNTEYQLQVMPYYRKWYSEREDEKVSISRNYRCAEMVSARYSISLGDGVKKCCQSNISSIIPLNVSVGAPEPSGNGTLNATVSWLLALTPELLEHVYPAISLEDEVQGDTLPEVSEHDSPLPTRPVTFSCSETLQRQTATLYNLLPNREYWLSLISWYPSEGNLCSQSRCKVKIKFRTDFRVSPCDSKWNICPNGTKCMAVNGSASILEAKCVTAGDDSRGVDTTELCVNSAEQVQKQVNGSIITSCLCPRGTYGDGVTTARRGTGCTGCPVNNSCGEFADCLAQDSATYSCQCDEHHYGDGMKDGTGCTSRAKRIAIIVVPVSITVLVIAAVICWCLCTRRSKTKHIAGSEARTGAL